MELLTYTILQVYVRGSKSHRRFAAIYVNHRDCILNSSTMTSHCTLLKRVISKFLTICWPTLVNSGIKQRALVFSEYTEFDVCRLRHLFGWYGEFS